MHGARNTERMVTNLMFLNCFFVFLVGGASSAVRYGFDPHDDSDNLRIHNNIVYNNGEPALLWLWLLLFPAVGVLLELAP